MNGFLSIAGLVVLLAVLGCARHHVVAREDGRVDGERSISTRSETAWTVHSAPEADDEASRSSD